MSSIGRLAFASYEILFVFWAHDSRGRKDRNEQTMPYRNRNSSINIHTFENAPASLKKAMFVADLRPAHAAHMVVGGLVHF